LNSFDDRVLEPWSFGSQFICAYPSSHLTFPANEKWVDKNTVKTIAANSATIKNLNTKLVERDD
jgi:hypothetical protein